MKVYVVMEDVSNYLCTIGIFSTRERADTWAAMLSTETKVEEWTVDPGAEQVEQGLHIYRVVANVEMAIVDYEAPYFINSVADGTNDLRLGPDVRANSKRNVYGYVWARDENHAIELIKEFRAQKIAEGEL